MKNKVSCSLFVFCLFANALLAQSPPSQTVEANVASAQAVSPGYKPSAGAGLNLTLGPGTSICNGSLRNYVGGTLTMSPGVTNYVYLDTSANCAPAASTKGRSPEGTLIATVFTGDASITKVEAAPTASLTALPLAGGGGGGISSLNRLTQSSQYFATGASGSDFNISSSGSTHTFNLPDASASARGLVNTGSQTFAGAKTFSTPIGASSGGTGANNAATAGLYLRGNGSSFVTSSVAAGGAGTCPANEFVTGTNDNAPPTCATLSGGGGGVSTIQFDANPALSGNVVWVSGLGLMTSQSGQTVTVVTNSASPTLQGTVVLANDLGGTAASPQVVGLHLTAHANTSSATNDTAGTITVPTTSATATQTFSTAYASPPSCVASPTSNPLNYWWVTTSTTGVAINFAGAPASSIQFVYLCFGNPN